MLMPSGSGIRSDAIDVDDSEYKSEYVRVWVLDQLVRYKRIPQSKLVQSSGVDSSDWIFLSHDRKYGDGDSDGAVRCWMYLYHEYLQKCGESWDEPTDPKTDHSGKRGGEGCSVPA